MQTTTVSKPSYHIESGRHVVSSVVNINGQEFNIWYKVSDGPVLQTSDPFLAASLIPAMKVGAPLRIEGTVSPRFLNATNTIQDIIHSWWPDFKKIPIEAEPRNSTESGLQKDIIHRGVGSFFSGGLDSFYTLLKHRDEITKIIFFYGFDVRLDDHVLRDKVARALQEIAEEFGNKLIEVETNLYNFFEHFGGLLSFGAAIGGIVLLLSPQLRKVYVPSSSPYNALIPLATHPLLDPLWSTEDTDIVHDGCEAFRVEKAALIAQFDVALKRLRVCNVSRNGDYNCSQCEKCLRSMAALRAVGALDRCPSFNQKIDLKALSEVVFYDKDVKMGYEATLQTVEKNGNDPEFAGALRTALINFKNRELKKELNTNLHSFLDSSDWLNTRRNTIFRCLWETDSVWLTKEILKENLKAYEKKLFRGILRRFCR